MPKSEKKNLSQIPPVFDRVLAAAKVAEENRGDDIVILDLREVTQMFDFFLFVSGSSRRQLITIGDEIRKKLVKEMGDTCLTESGRTEGKWIALDFGDIIIHLFEPETRNFYAIEELWEKAKAVKIDPTAVEP